MQTKTIKEFREIFHDLVGIAVELEQNGLEVHTHFSSSEEEQGIRGEVDSLKRAGYIVDGVEFDRGQFSMRVSW